jgi:hypothetical protein
LIWRPNEGEALREIGSYPGRLPAFAVTPDGRGLLSADDKNNVILNDLATGREVRRFAVDGRVWHLSIVPSQQAFRAIVFVGKHGELAAVFQMADLSVAVERPIPPQPRIRPDTEGKRGESVTRLGR